MGAARFRGVASRGGLSGGEFELAALEFLIDLISVLSSAHKP